MKNSIITLGILCGLLQAMPALAGSQPLLVIQVPASFYQHPVRLLHPFVNYWHPRAEAAEEAGLTAFAQHDYTTASCAAGAQGQALVVIEPNLFYNPQLGTFYSEIKARVYAKPGADSALGKPLLAVKGEGMSRGTIAHNVELFTQRAYQQAFSQVIAQLQQDPAFASTLSQAPTANFEQLCASIDTLSQPKIFY